MIRSFNDTKHDVFSLKFLLRTTVFLFERAFEAIFRLLNNRRLTVIILMTDADMEQLFIKTININIFYNKYFFYGFNTLIFSLFILKASILFEGISRGVHQ